SSVSPRREPGAADDGPRTDSSFDQQHLGGSAQVLAGVVDRDRTPATDAHRPDEELGVPTPLTCDLKAGYGGVGGAADLGPAAASLEADRLRVRPILEDQHAVERAGRIIEPAESDDAAADVDEAEVRVRGRGVASHGR